MVVEKFDGKKGSKATGLSIALTLAAVLLLASWLFAFGGVGVASSQLGAIALTSLAATPVNETYQFITYRNAQWGFSLEHPVGFYAEEADRATPAFTAYAGASGGVTEVIQVLIDNSTNANAEFPGLLASSSDAGQTTSSVFKTTSGETAHLVKTVSALPIVASFSNETATVYQALFDCSDAEGQSYAALLLVSIPQSLSVDLPVAEYVVNSFKCSRYG